MFKCSHGRRGSSLGIDFYSGFRKKIQVYTFIVASEKKNTIYAIRNPKINPGIDFIVASGKPPIAKSWIRPARNGKM